MILILIENESDITNKDMVVPVATYRDPALKSALKSSAVCQGRLLRLYI